jgi:hypothetical protein
VSTQEPIFDVAQLAHVEVMTADLEGSLWFYKDLLGMLETERGGPGGGSPIKRTGRSTCGPMRTSTTTR